MTDPEGCYPEICMVIDGLWFPPFQGGGSVTRMFESASVHGREHRGVEALGTPSSETLQKLASRELPSQTGS